eukprot:395809_1
MSLLTPTFLEDQDQKDDGEVSDITFIATVRIPVDMPKGVIIGNYGKDTDAIQFEVENGKIQVWWNGEGWTTGTSDLRDGKIHIVTGCRDVTLNSLSVYVDGIRENRLVKELRNLKFKHQLLIGQDYEGRVFKGDILKYYVYQCSFNDKQIHQIVKEWKTPNKPFS